MVMPAAFFGHGSPMNTLERNRYTDAWRAFGQAVEPPGRRGRFGPLVHQCHCGHGDGVAPYHPRLLRVPR